MNQITPLSCENQPPPPLVVDLAASYGCILASTEVGLGSFLHSLHIPLSGQFLSLNQVFLLSHSMTLARGSCSSEFLPAAISSLGATLKSLAPAGKKLTPMVAIAMQGWLYNGGTLLLGNSLGGRALGAALASLWAFVQPVLFLGFVFSLEWRKLYTAVAHLVPFDSIVAVIIAVVATKAVVAVLLSLLAFYLPQERVTAYFSRLNALGNKQRLPEKHAIGTMASLRRSLLRPLFIVPLLITIIAASFVESSWVSVVWICLRPLALAVVFFLLVRLLSRTRGGEYIVSFLPAGFRQALQLAWERFQRR
jgi:hypothetical protein